MDVLDMFIHLLVCLTYYRGYIPKALPPPCLMHTILMQNAEGECMPLALQYDIKVIHVYGSW